INITVTMIFLILDADFSFFTGALTFLLTIIVLELEMYSYGLVNNHPNLNFLYR
ncbi:MAG: hypothetical protein Lokiarch_22040, partial [Candidatus Lokiarchaeum sp. GC14_75]